MGVIRGKNGGLYKDYDDWYDNGPGSEAFKRKLLSRKALPFPDLSPKSQGPTMPPKKRSYEMASREILANFIGRCFKLGIPSKDCSQLIAIIEPDPDKLIEALRVWLERNDDNAA
jgi:hypothetical protein